MSRHSLYLIGRFIILVIALFYPAYTWASIIWVITSCFSIFVHVAVIYMPEICPIRTHQDPQIRRMPESERKWIINRGVFIEVALTAYILSRFFNVASFLGV